MNPYYERLSTLDASFLSFDDPDAHMQLGSVSLLEAAPFQNADGELDFARIERTVLQILPKHPRLRQKVWWPVGGPPVWVDDPTFDPSYHLRRCALRSPAGESELKNLAGEFLSTRLDPARPLWEACIVEGCEGGERFALIWKLHHCIADGVSVRDILFGYLNFQPTTEPPETAPFTARPAPGVGRLHLDAAMRRLEKSREAAALAQEFLRTASLPESFRNAANGFLQMTANFMAEIPATPLNGKIGPHRRFDWTSCELSVLQEIRKESGAKINDVVLAAVCGAIRRFLLEKKSKVDELAFRVMCPVSTRAEADSSDGNRVSNMMLELPLAETDPRRRLQTIVANTTRAKASGQSWIADALLQAIDWAGVQVPMPLARLASQQIPANLVVTNVPGPQVPQYLLDSQLTESFPVVPLAKGQGLGVALYSYNRVMHWGFNADRELLPDIHEFVRAVDVEIQQLQHAHIPIAVKTRAPLRALHGESAGGKTPRRKVKQSQ